MGSLDFPWANALASYKLVGLEIEKGTLEWTGMDTMKELRMTYSMTVFPERRDAREGTRMPIDGS